MRRSKNPYSDIKKKHRERLVKRLSRIAFTGSTLRMFKAGSADRLRGFVTRQIGDGRLLRTIRDRKDFDERFSRIIRKFPKRRVQLSKGPGKPGFGHKAKIVALYFKALYTEKDPLDERTRKRLGNWMHVPLDNIVLEWVLGDFKRQLAEQGALHKKLKLSTLGECEYWVIQNVLRQYADRVPVPPIWYDDLWADRKRKKQ